MVTDNQKIQTPTFKLEVGAPQIRTPEAMKQDMQKKVPQFPVSEGAEQEGGGGAPQAPSAAKRRQKPFLPMMDATEYVAQKNRARPKAPFPFLGTRGAAGRIAPEKPLAPVTAASEFEGGSDVDEETPPDTHGAIGSQEFVEVTNSHINIFSKSAPATPPTSISHSAFFGYLPPLYPNATALFDARAVYDSTWNRWIVTADAFPESPTVQYQFVAISTTSSATGPFFIYPLNITFRSGDFWDYPQLGMDQDAIIITANIFDASGNPPSADMFAVAKARLYNGLGFSVPVFTGLVGTLAPPIVLDQNSTTFLIAAQPIGSALQLYALRDSSRSGITLTGPVDVPVDAYTLPSSARQPSCSSILDTLDSRFVNASTQVGDSLWQVHTIDDPGLHLPTPRFYQINTATNSVTQSGYFFADGPSSYDFNASIAANSDNDVFVCWTSTDLPPGPNVNPQVRFAACDHNDGPTCVLGAGSALFTSPNCLNGSGGVQRWGDYSAVTVDPSNPRQAWVVNETVNDAGDDWSSHIGTIGF